MKKLNLPNILTMLRVLFVPFFVAFMIYGIFPEPEKYIFCAAIFAITALTDLLDGKIARKYNMVTNFGKFMDALADKFMVYSAYIAILFAIKDKPSLSRAILWLTVVIILRDIIINGIRMLAAGKGEVIAAQFSGKLKTMTQSISVVLILAERAAAVITKLAVFENGVISYIAIALTFAATLWSGIDYISSYAKYIDFDN